jgi:hypothetical protein
MSKTKECQSCHNEFRVWQEIDGVMKSLQTRRYCLTCAPYKSGRKKRLSKYREDTRLCAHCGAWKPLTSFYVDSSGWCKQCINERAYSRAKENKRLAVEYKGGICFDCGIKYPAHVYDFHHIDPNEKDFKLSQFRTRLLRSIRAELDKCVLLCSNCHRDRHYNKHNPNYCPLR